MKKLSVLIIFSSLTLVLFAQRETFDLTTYTAPTQNAGWTKEAKDNFVTYTIADNKKKTWCRIAIFKSTTSKGNIERDFESEWQLLVSSPFKTNEAPQTNKVQESGDWKIKTGAGKFIFNAADAIALLTCMSSNNRCVSILTITNSEDYNAQIQKFSESVKLLNPQNLSTKPTENPRPQTGESNNTTVIVGSWGKSNTVGQLYNRFGTYSYNKQQYIFNSNGTYRFTGKNYSEQYDETLLVKENGTYKINGNSLTISPQNSVIEAWTKKNGADNWNKLKTSQKRALEKTTYQFSVVEKNLVLQTTKETERDGRFSSGNSYSYGPPGTFTAIKLPGE